MSRYIARYDIKTSTYEVLDRLTNTVVANNYGNRTAAKYAAENLNTEKENVQ